MDVRVIAATHCDFEQAILDGRFREDLYYRLNIIRIEVPPLRERKEEILPLVQFFIKKHSKPSDAPLEISAAARQALLAHPWPGNIRELENVTRKMVILQRPELVVEELKLSELRRQTLIARGGSHNGHGTANRAPADISSKTPSTMASEQETRHSPGSMMAHSEDPSMTIHSADAGTVRGRPPQTSVLRKVDEARKQAESDAIVTALNASLWNRKEAAVLLNVEYKALLYKMKKLRIGKTAVQAAGQ